jgi:hypothetical protein
VADYAVLRATDPNRWLGGMRRLRQHIMGDDGRVDLKRMLMRE